MAEQTPVDFSREEIEAESDSYPSSRPWAMSKKFGSEIDADDMADSAAAYLRAACEVSDVGDLSRRATALAADAGSVDGDTLVDGDGRIRATDQALGKGEVDETVRALFKAVNRAIAAEEEVHDRVWGPGQCEDTFKKHLAAARADYHAVMAEVKALGAPIEPYDDEPLSRTVNGFTFTAEPYGEGYVPAAGVLTRLRKRHYDEAVADAEGAAWDIHDAIHSYRKDLASAAAELDPTGFDLTGGPLRMWLTPEMAAWAAEGLIGQFENAGSLDLGLVAQYTDGLDAIFRSVYGGDEPGAPLRDMTAAERRYLLAFHRILGEDGGPYGRDYLTGLVSGLVPLDPGDEGRRRVVFERLADSVTMLLDPEIGGIDPRDPDARDDVPSSVRRWVYGEPDIEWLKPVTDRPSGAEIWDMQQLTGFGDLMSAGRLTHGEHLGRDMAEAAVRLQGRMDRTDMDWGEWTDPRQDLAGPDNMLRAVSADKELSASLLTDPVFREGLLSRSWPAGAGPAMLIESGTTPPEGAAPGSAEARPYERAAREVAEAGSGAGVPWWIERGGMSPGGQRVEAALADVRDRAGVPAAGGVR
ncbi:hypothetical protein [Streptomyces sp. NPDC049879]|uniref:hypothetical protein n=1 Tax=Streptomyces sp. NPDC049879 TaxID=3365598 RepID=UPI0037973018